MANFTGRLALHVADRDAPAIRRTLAPLMGGGAPATPRAVARFEAECFADVRGRERAWSGQPALPALTVSGNDSG